MPSLFAYKFPKGLTDEQLTQFATQELEVDKAPFTQERFVREVVDMGESAFMGEWEYANEVLGIQSEAETKQRDTELNEGFDFPNFDEISEEWLWWKVNYYKTYTESLETSITNQLRENKRKIKEEEEADKKSL